MIHWKGTITGGEMRPPARQNLPERLCSRGCICEENGCDVSSNFPMGHMRRSVPRRREITCVLPLLKHAGITHLALETNDQARLDQAVRSQTVTPATDGWFTAEPQRAALLRAAMTLHLPIVAFDMDEADDAWMGEHPDDSGE